MWRWIGVIDGESIYQHVEKPGYQVISIKASDDPNETRYLYFLRDNQVGLEKRIDIPSLYAALDIATEYIEKQ